MTNQDGHSESDSGTWKSMLDACSSGDVELLQKLFNKHGIQRGSKPIPVRFVATGGSQADPKESIVPIMPATDELLEQAVAARQINVVHLILHTYPSISLNQSHGVVRAVLENPDAEVLEALCNHAPDFASFSIDSGLRTFLTDACTLPPDQAVPILNVLLDNGADVDDGWGPGGGALFAAVIGHQPVEIINKILSKGINVSSRVAVPAIQQSCVDIIRALLSNKNATLKVDVQECIEEAERRGDKEIIMIVKDWAQDRAKIVSRRNADERSRKKWWAFRRFGIN
ncbi:hypothetical protein F4860DRAFT_481320 [Xylaria cubensis]|nr:hypothetical protein F4860DRAFT_481320 [Xylaria cubensis]